VTLHFKVDDAKETADVSGTVGKQTVKAGDNPLKKSNDPVKKTTIYEGGITIGTDIETLQITLHDEANNDGKKAFESQVTSFHEVFANNGTYKLALIQPLPPAQDYEITFDVTVGAGSAVPEPSSLSILGIGATCLLGYVWRRGKRAGRPGPSMIAA
jgi:hypothetical protein